MCLTVYRKDIMKTTTKKKLPGVTFDSDLNFIVHNLLVMSVTKLARELE